MAHSYDADQRSSRFVVFRLRAQGQPDHRFGFGGTTTLDFGSEAEGNAIAPVSAGDGAVAVGEAYPTCPPGQCVNDRAIAVAQVR